MPQSLQWCKREGGTWLFKNIHLAWLALQSAQQLTPTLWKKYYSYTSSAFQKTGYTWFLAFSCEHLLLSLWETLHYSTSCKAYDIYIYSYISGSSTKLLTRPWRAAKNENVHLTVNFRCSGSKSFSWAMHSLIRSLLFFSINLCGNL